MQKEAWFDALVIIAAAAFLVGSLIAVSAWLDARKYGPDHIRRRPIILSIAMVVAGMVLTGTLTAWTPGVQKIREKQEEAELEQALDDTTPTVQALHRYYPAEYLKVVAVAKAHRDDAVQIHDGVAGIVRDLVQTHLAKLDVVSARTLFRMMLADAVAAHGHDPAACVETLDTGIATPATLLNPEAVGLDPAATAAMLQQLAVRPTTPTQPIERAELHRLFAAARPGLPPAARKALDSFVRTGAPLDRDPVTCDLLIGLARFTIEHAPDDMKPLLAAVPDPDDPSQPGSGGTYWRI